jgi:ABC-type multidrug transport system fused ATPase/permease subunit
MEGIGASRKIFEYMNRQPEISYNGAVQKPIEGQVDFANVTFSYPTRPGQNVLKVSCLVLVNI